MPRKHTPVPTGQEFQVVATVLHKRPARFVGALAAAALSLEAAAAGANSAYLRLVSDTGVTGTQVLLTTTINVSTAGTDVLLEADGRYSPTAPGRADVFITVDSAKVSNDGAIDWSSSTDARPHSFNVVGAARLGSGSHTISLVGVASSGAFTVGADSNLIVMTRPASTLLVQSLPSDTGPYDFTTAGITPGTPAPHTPLLSSSFDAGGAAVIGLASGRARYAGGYGDAMLGIYLDGANAGNDKSLWTVNDVWTGAELEAPLYTHAFFPDLTGPHTVSLDATEIPWGGPPNPAEDSVIYDVGSASSLIALFGGMTVHGSAWTSPAVDNWWDFVCVGSSQAWPGCPPAGTPRLLAGAAVDVPQGHNGVVMILAKSRFQGDASDVGGTATLYLTIDGNRVGSVGVQECGYPNCVSQRTMSASYLAAGPNALPVGSHRVEVWGQIGSGDSFIHLATVRDLPLVWFDGPQCVDEPDGAPCPNGSCNAGSCVVASAAPPRPRGCGCGSAGAMAAGVALAVRARRRRAAQGT